MTVATVRAVLVAAVPVTSIAPAERIEALRRTQSLALPAITLTDVSKVPFSHLRSSSGLCLSTIQVDCLAADYTSALNLATAVRTALETAGHTLDLQIERNEPETDPELFQITQSWSVFSS